MHNLPNHDDAFSSLGSSDQGHLINVPWSQEVTDTPMQHVDALSYCRNLALLSQPSGQKEAEESAALLPGKPIWNKADWMLEHPVDTLAA
jgi:hypothetical protein